MVAKSLDHIADHRVSDTERSLRLYCDVLGSSKQVEQHPARRSEDRNGTRSRRSPRSVDPPRCHGYAVDPDRPHGVPHASVSEPCLAPTGAVGSTHFCLAVDDLANVYQRLKAEGVEFVSEPVTFELTEGSVTVVFTHDPDGNVVELTDQHEG